MPMSVMAAVPIYEVDDQETKLDRPHLTVRSHRTHNRAGGWITLETENHARITVSAADLEKALRACTGLG